MKILVTGGTGFIGTRVVKRLRKGGHKVHVLSARLSQAKVVEQEIKGFMPECIIHLAWEGLPKLDTSLSKKNVEYGKLICSLAAKYKIPKLIITGSAWEYESKKEQELHRHRSFVQAKQTLNRYGRQTIRKYKGTFIWAVPFFVYGDGKKSTSLIPSLIAQAKKGMVPMPHNPDAWHDFVYVDDVAQAVTLIATKQVPAGSYDIGTGVLTRTGSIAQEIARQLKLPMPSLTKVRAQGHVANIRPLIQAVRWKAETSLKEGVTKIIRHAH